MDARFSTNNGSNAFKTLSNSISPEGCGMGTGNATDTVLRLDSPGSISASKGVKRKWSLRDGTIDMEAEVPLCLWLGHSSSSSDSKASSATGCTTMSSHKETDEESSMDIDLDFSLHLGGEKMPIQKIFYGFNKVSSDLQDHVDLELSLSATPAESDIGTVQPSCVSRKIPLTVGSDLYMNEGSVSSHPITQNSFHLLESSGNKNCPISSSIITIPTSSVTWYCKGHGGGKRCAFEGDVACPKSVHGGTLFCVAHGGGKRCAVPDCTRSARGRTDCCVRHGGGRRCKFEECGKSAQGSTDFCKAHGGGKRCSWGRPGSEYGKGDDVYNLFGRGKNGLCTSHGALVQDKRVHGGATLGTLVQDTINTDDMNIDTNVMAPAQFTSCGWTPFGIQQEIPVGREPSQVSEGRVHGGSLIAWLAGSSGESSDQGKVNMMPRKWI